jgi:hypothetical protein
LRIPWNLLNVTDPSNFQIVSSLAADGTVETSRTPGIVLAAFSYQPLATSQVRPIMEQGHPVADSLPPLTGPATLPVGELRQYLWAGWNAPQYLLRLKTSYDILRKAFLALPATPPTTPATGP